MGCRLRFAELLRVGHGCELGAQDVFVTEGLAVGALSQHVTLV